MKRPIVDRLGPVLPLATALAGLMNLFSALFPAFHWRYLLLRDMVSVSVINDSQMATVLLGMLLILLADRLAKRHRRAMWLTLAVLAVSALVHLTKGLDYEEAVVCLGLAALLFARRSEYVVPSRPFNLTGAITTIGSFGLLFYAYDLLGFRILSHWITPRPTLVGALLEPVRLALDSPWYTFHGRQAHWFGTSILVLGAMALLASALILLRPFFPHRGPNGHERGRALAILRRWGTDTLSYFSLREDRSLFFDQTGEAFLSYRIWRNVALVGGDPVGAPQQVASLTRQFLEFCRTNGLSPCFLGTHTRYLGVYREAGLRVLKIGEECLIRLPEFDVAALKRKVRRAERHCLDLGIQAEMTTAAELPSHFREQALAVSREWVRSKGGAERGFSMTLGRLPGPSDEGRVLVAHQDGRLIGFLTFVPVYGSNGWSLDMMRRVPDCPNGLTEFMVLQAARAFQSDGAHFMSLNFASLSSTEAVINEPRLVSSTRRFLFDNLSSVYQLKSLYHFNTKFDPEWTSRYLVYGDIMKAPKVFMAVVQAEDPIKLSTLAAVFRR